MFVKSALSSRADLLRWIRYCGSPEELNEVARFLGYKALKNQENSVQSSAQIKIKTPAITVEAGLVEGKVKRKSEKFHYVIRREAVKEVAFSVDPQEAEKPLSLQNVKAYGTKDKNLQIPEDAPQPLTWQDIAPVARINAFLRKNLSQPGARRLDIEILVKKVAYLHPLYKLPKRNKSIPAGKVTVLMDLNHRLLPFWEDCHRLCEIITQKHGRLGLDIRVLREGPYGKSSNWFDSNSPKIKWSLPPAGSVVLILSDLGQLAEDGGFISKCWKKLGNRLKQHGINPLVLTPLSKGQQHGELNQYYNQHHWDRTSLCNQVESEIFKKQLERILSLLSPSVNIEPELLRAVCRLLPAEQSHSGLEAAIWMHHDVLRGYTAIQIREERRTRYLQNFAQEEALIQKQVLQLIKQHHARQFPGVWARELLLAAEVVKFPIDQLDNLKNAEVFFKRVARSLYENTDNRGMVLYSQRELQRLSKKQKKENKYYSALYTLAFLEEIKSGDKKLEDWVDTNESLAVMAQIKPLQTYHLLQNGQNLYLQPAGSKDAPVHGSQYLKLELNREGIFVNGHYHKIKVGKPIVDIRQFDSLKLQSDKEEITISSLRKADWIYSIGRDRQGLYRDINNSRAKPQRHWWHPPDLIENQCSQRGIWYPDPPEHIKQPFWATTMGWDKYGLYADFSYKDIIQRMRWIEPGIYFMGSPETKEPERDDDEVLHQIIFSKGFWLADSTVTQALWQLVMGNNPSHFKGDLLPVENVSWNDAQAFIKKLNQLTGASFGLPGEAQWEYACRAGTQTPFSFGRNITTEQVNFNGNYPYNKGKKGEYRGKTIAVKSLPANPWGLYEMHGNVWEWCQDSWEEAITKEPVTDPEPASGGDRRVVRGGSWISGGRNVRSAFRFRYQPDDRYLDIGFRLSPGQ